MADNSKNNVTYNLALPSNMSRYDRHDPKAQKTARSQADTDEEKLDTRRQDFQHEGNELRDIINTMVAMQQEALACGAKIVKLKSTPPTTDKSILPELAELEKKKAYAEETYQALFNMASLKGLLVLHQGLALMSDMLSVADYDIDEKTGKKIHSRVSVADIMWDATRCTMVLNKRLKITNQMLEDLGVRHEAFVRGKYIKIKDGQQVDEAEPEASEGEELEGPVPAGVPVEDKPRLSKENIIKMVRGDESEKK